MVESIHVAIFNVIDSQYKNASEYPLETIVVYGKAIFNEDVCPIAVSGILEDELGFGLN